MTQPTQGPWNPDIQPEQPEQQPSQSPQPPVQAQPQSPQPPPVPQLPVQPQPVTPWSPAQSVQPPWSANQPAPWEPSPSSQAAMPSPPSRRALVDLVEHLDQQPKVRAGGLRGLLGMGPSHADIERAEDKKALRAIWPRPVSIAVATPKGGAGKTPTAVGLAAAFGLERGGSVVAWDDNEMRGTLSYRTFRSHAYTVTDLLREKDFLLRPDSRIADVQHFMNWQPTGQFWTLASARDKGIQITDQDFQSVWQIVSRFYGLVIIDTGNNEVADSWREAVHGADVIVVPIKWTKDDLILAYGMVEALEREGRAADRIIVVGTNAPSLHHQVEEQHRIREEATSWFEGRPLLEIPPDPHIASGAEIDWDQYLPATQRAYEHLGATASHMMSLRFR